MNMKISDYMSPGQVWTSEWDVEWKVVEVTDNRAIVKRVGGRSLHDVYMREVENWTRADEVAAMREP